MFMTHTSVERLLKWITMVLLVIVLIALPLSGLFWFQHTRGGGPRTWYSACGMIGYIKGPRLAYNTPEGLHFGTFASAIKEIPNTDQRWHWLPQFQRAIPGTFPTTELVVPLWMIAGALATPLGVLWLRSRRRVKAGGCVKCGYDLRGLSAGVKCPECGRIA